MKRTAVIEVPRAESDPLAWFTPEGERRWVHGWDPIYPDPTRTDGVGTVFVTYHGSRETIWVIVDRTPTAVRYARTTPRFTAGTVEVRVKDAKAHATVIVAVTYELTALTAAGSAFLAQFDAGFDAEIATWQRHIEASVRSPDG